MERKKGFTFKASKKVVTSVIEITDDEDSLSPVKNDTSRFAPSSISSTATSGMGSTFATGIYEDDNDEVKIGSNVSLSTDDVNDLDSFLNSKQEYISAVEKLQKNMNQIRTYHTPEPSTKRTELPPAKSASKFKFQQPKSTTSKNGTPTSTAPTAKTIPDIFKNVFSQNAREKPTSSLALPTTFEPLISSQDSTKENYALSEDDDKWDSIVSR